MTENVDPKVVKGLTPKRGVVKTRPAERLLAKFASARVAHPPDDDTLRDLLSDTFMAMYKQAPELKDDEHTPPERSVNKTLLNWAMSQDSFKSATVKTANNMVAASVSASTLYEALSSDKALEEALEAQKQAESAEQSAQDADKAAQECEKEGDQKGKEFWMEKADEYRKTAKDIAQQANERLDKTMQNSLAQGMIAKAVKSAGEKGREVADKMAGWGIDGEGVNVKDVDDVLRLVNDTGSQLSEIAKLVGRLKGHASDAIKNVKLTYTGIRTEPAMTKDVSRLFPSELARLTTSNHPVLRMQAFAQFMSGGLLGWKPIEEGELQGSFWAEVDDSGSMHGNLSVIARALSLSIARALIEDNKTAVVKRKYGMSLFGSLNKHPFVTSEMDWKAHVEWAGLTGTVGGGTNFDYALNDAMSHIEQMDKDGDVADMLFVSDGEAGISQDTVERWRKFKARFNTRMIYVQVGYGGYPYISELADLRLSLSHYDSNAIINLTRQIAEYIARKDYSGD